MKKKLLALTLSALTLQSLVQARSDDNTSNEGNAWGGLLSFPIHSVEAVTGNGPYVHRNRHDYYYEDNGRAYTFDANGRKIYNETYSKKRRKTELEKQRRESQKSKKSDSNA